MRSLHYIGGAKVRIIFCLSKFYEKIPGRCRGLYYTYIIIGVFSLYRENVQNIDELAVDRFIDTYRLIERNIYDLVVLHSDHDVALTVLKGFDGGNAHTACKDTVIMGTVGYASPEQLGVTQSDARTDIYAAGVLLNVMLTGKHPTEAFARGRIGRIVRKCTALNPADRYQSAEELSAKL